MNSITKNYLDKETIKKLVKHNFRENSIVNYEKVEGGFCNAVYRIRLKDEKDVILKVAPDVNIQLMSCEKSMMQTEAEAMSLAQNYGIPGVPNVYAYDDSKRLCSSAYIFMENKYGNSLADEKELMSGEKRKQTEFEIGRILKRINTIKGEKFGHFCVKELQYDNWFEAFYHMFSGVISDGINAKIEIGVSYKDILDKLLDDKKYFAEVTQPRLIHFDSWDGNFLMKNEKITGIIDWERAMWAEGLMEDKFRFHSVSQDFLQGYGMETFTVSQKIRSYWYDIYLYLIMMFEVTYRQYETNEQYDWVHGLFIQVWDSLLKIR